MFSIVSTVKKVELQPFPTSYFQNDFIKIHLSHNSLSENTCKFF